MRGEKTKRRISSVILSILLISSFLSFVSIASATISNDQIEPKVPKININADSVLKDRGYSYTSETAPKELMLQILRSYQIDQGKRGADGELYYTITPDSPKAAHDIIGSDSVIPYELPTTMHVKTSDYASSENPVESTDYLQEGKAALVFAIMDYPGEGMDLPSLQDAYNEA
ncbi:MAG: hypothetical protein M1167_03010 [Chloroflexi bacterium]|nr:hypothetical protein [Chloroflexota bacterium]